MVRAANEDSLCISPALGLFAVADGMGGHQAGEIASSMALKLLEENLGQRLKAGEIPAEALVNAVQQTNRTIYEMAGQNPVWTGMGTTLTACLCQGSRLFLAQVGDSRAYLLRDGDIIQLTEDHSLVQELLKSGGITEEQAISHPQRNILTRAVGAKPFLTVDLYRAEVITDDLLLLCTDGLTEYLRADDILYTVINAPDIDSALQNLLKKSLQSGGSDNITAVLVSF
jgi:protein phosphatase